MQPQAAYDYIASFARSIGVPDHLVTSALDAISAPAERAHDEASLRELVGDLTPQAEHAQRVAERERGQRDAAKFEDMLRDPEGSRKYWANPALQQEYREALERSLVEVPVMPTAPPAAPSPEPAAPSPAAAPAVPPVQPVAAP